jgi:DNA-binding response OmpR family regulator
MDFPHQPSSWDKPSGESAGTVLLVDDDPTLRSAMRDFLANSGCRVLEARDSYDGLFLCAQYGAAIDVLVTEINLLPVSGIKLAENVLRLWPQIQVLCMSDCEEGEGVQHWMRYLNAEFLRKPFSPFHLHERVHGLMGKRYEDAPMPVLDFQPPAAEPQKRYTSMQDPLFWLKEF